MKKLRIAALSLTLCAALIVSGCNGNTETTTTEDTSTTTTPAYTSAELITNPPINVDSSLVALTVNGSDVSLGSYIFYRIAASSDAVTAAKLEYPDEEITSSNINNYTVEGLPAVEWIRNKTIYYCKQLVNIESNFKSLGLELTEQETTNTEKDIVTFWEGEDQRLSIFFGYNYKSWGEYYTSLGIDRESYERACYASAKQVAVFNHFYGENGIEKSSDEDIKAYIAENYAQCQYFSMKTYSFISEEKVLELANKYISDIESGDLNVAQAKSEYLYFFNQQSLLDDIEQAKKAGTEYTGDRPEDVVKSTVSDTEITYIVTKTDTTPTKDAVEKIFSLEIGKPTLYIENDYYYLLYRTDILSDSDAYAKYKPYAMHALSDNKFMSKFTDEIENAEVIQHDDVLSTIA